VLGNDVGTFWHSGVGAMDVPCSLANVALDIGIQSNRREWKADMVPEGGKACAVGMMSCSNPVGVMLQAKKADMQSQCCLPPVAMHLAESLHRFSTKMELQAVQTFGVLICYCWKLLSFSWHPIKLLKETRQ